MTRGVINRGQPHDPGTWVASHTRRLVQPTIFRNNIYENKDAGQGSEEGNGQIDIITLYNVYIKYFFVDTGVGAPNGLHKQNYLQQMVQMWAQD